MYRVRQKFTDITLIFRSYQNGGNEKIVNAHRVILSQRSLYFEKLFSGIFKEANQSKIIIKVDDVESAARLIEWLYYPIDYTVVDTPDLQRLADMWLLRPDNCSHYEIETEKYWPLLKMCITLLEGILSSKNMDTDQNVDYSNFAVMKALAEIMVAFISIFGITPEDFSAKHFGLNNLYDNSNGRTAAKHFEVLIFELISQLPLVDYSQFNGLFEETISEYLFGTCDLNMYLMQCTRVKGIELVLNIEGIKQLGESHWYVYGDLLIKETEHPHQPRKILVAAKRISRGGSGYLLSELTPEEKQFAKQLNCFVIKGDSTKFMEGFLMDLLYHID